MKEHNENLLPPASLARQIDQLRDDLRNEQDRNLRTLADFTNYRCRIERDGNKLAEEGKREVLRSLLSIVDDLDNALKWRNHGDQALVNGVQIIHKKVVALLEAYGVRSFESVGKPFTPDLHEAVAMTRRTNVEPGTIVEVLRQGYLWKDELLRPAQVKVAE